MLIEMAIKGLMIDQVTSTPIIVLRDTDATRVLEIWVGVFEANAIAVQICGTSSRISRAGSSAS
jgi:bifunctional DNase/RNase